MHMHACMPRRRTNAHVTNATSKPMRHFLDRGATPCDVNVRCLLEARTVLQGEVLTGWVGNTLRCIGP